MPRGRGAPRGPRRGRGRGPGRGFRGAFHGGTDSQAGDGELVFEGNFEDFTQDNVFSLSRSRGASPAPSRGGYQTPPPMFQPSEGRGARSPGRGIGFPVNNNTTIAAPRSSVSISTLERDRPLLRPVTFVRGQNQKTLFEEVEEILGAPREKGGSTVENPTPSAGVVEKLFRVNDTGNKDIIDGNSTSEDNTDAKPDAAETAAITDTTMLDISPGPTAQDTQPQESTVDSVAVHPIPIGAIIYEEEAIVYDAPRPRIGRRTPAVPSSSLASPQPPPVSGGPSISNAAPFASEPQIPAKPEPNSLPASKPLPTRSESKRPAREIRGPKLSPVSRRLAKKERAAAMRRAERESPPSPTRSESKRPARVIRRPKLSPVLRRLAKKGRVAAARRAEQEAMFDSAGLGLSVHELNALYRGAFAKVDTRKSERRRGDSDVDWGTNDDGDIEDMGSEFNGMELDPEVPDIAQFALFAQGVSGRGAGEILTIADLEDIKKIEDEDEGEGTANDDTSDQDDGVLDAKERKQNGEGSDSSSSEYSDGEIARRGLQARSERLLAKQKEETIVDVGNSSPQEEGTDDNEISGSESSWEGNGNRMLEDLLDENHDVLHGRDRKARKKLLKSVQNGEFLYEDYNTRKRDRDISFHLRGQRHRDQTRKAALRRIRKRLLKEQTAEYAMHEKRTENVFGSARFEGDTYIVSRTADMATLEQQIRVFLGDLGLKVMVLPPKSKEWRTKAHRLAGAFNLKSKSRGKGKGRHTTLIKTTRSGTTNLNERKISRLASNNDGGGFQTSRPFGIREGDEVGKTAPKLSETNIGFKLLQQMGWAEGDRIGGATGGLVDPLTAVIKTTKLGLGAVALKTRDTSTV